MLHVQTDDDVRPYHAASQIPVVPEGLSCSDRLAPRRENLVERLFEVMTREKQLASRRRSLEGGFIIDPERAAMAIRQDSLAIRREEAAVFTEVAELCSEVASEYRDAADTFETTRDSIGATLFESIRALGFETDEGVDPKYQRPQRYGLVTKMIEGHHAYRDAERSREKQAKLAEPWSNHTHAARQRAGKIIAEIRAEQARRGAALLEA